MKDYTNKCFVEDYNTKPEWAKPEGYYKFVRRYTKIISMEQGDLSASITIVQITVTDLGFNMYKPYTFGQPNYKENELNDGFGKEIDPLIFDKVMNIAYAFNNSFFNIIGV